MCGIAGLVTPIPGKPREELELCVRRMMAALEHRGPDAAGVWFDESQGIVLGHRRLSVIDLSPHGSQPMVSADGRLVIVFNGEIYNFQDLRRELLVLGHRFRGYSDTEVAVTAVQQWGLEGALPRLIGMFALAVWDRRECCLYLARDRLGEKPLYYGWLGDYFAFGSELRALRALPDWDAHVDRRALTLFFRRNYVPAPFSIYRDVSKLEAGYYLRLTRTELASRTPPIPVAYWSLRDVVHRLDSCGRNLTSEAAAVEWLDDVLRKVVSQMLVSDVPLGAFLSGGIDSSIVVALMQAISSSRIKTYTIGFAERGFNEAEAAKRVANHVGTDHSEFYLSSAEAAALVPSIATTYDEPFADASQIPTRLICGLARRHVTVALAGDGGDEAFGGYPRYMTIDRAWQMAQLLPDPLRRRIARLVEWLNATVRPYNVARFERLKELLAAADTESMYAAIMSYWRLPAELMAGEEEEGETRAERMEPLDDLPLVEKLMYIDALTYLPDDLLVKVDRASMAVGLEMRLPFTDHRVVEFAWSLPVGHKVRNRQGKWILRRLLRRYVPDELIDRPKMGFSVPLDAWLRGPLRDWAESLVGEERLRREGMLNPRLVRQRWNEHVAGTRNWSNELWSVLMYQAWLEETSNTIQNHHHAAASAS